MPTEAPQISAKPFEPHRFRAGSVWHPSVGGGDEMGWARAEAELRDPRRPRDQDAGAAGQARARGRASQRRRRRFCWRSPADRTGLQSSDRKGVLCVRVRFVWQEGPRLPVTSEVAARRRNPPGGPNWCGMGPGKLSSFSFDFDFLFSFHFYFLFHFKFKSNLSFTYFNAHVKIQHYTKYIFCFTIIIIFS